MKRLHDWFYSFLAAVIVLVVIGTGYLFYLRALPEVYAVGPKPFPVAVGVERGDTLWSIAQEFYPGRHTGEVVHAIRTANPGIDPGRLQVGQRVILPEVE